MSKINVNVTRSGDVMCDMIIWVDLFSVLELDVSLVSDYDLRQSLLLVNLHGSRWQ